ncbi:MAG: ABC transporter ATP-binding protein [Desulfobacteraceae bacterium]|nr:ABC transporter ATP-binding protein [Desulfobacteraceae bacterium]MBC2756661.1 ABC transporter ATP-binding protein [Desulfobacteraceae bacterium]
MNKNQIIIKMSGVHFSYSEESPILKDLDFEFFKGDKVGIIAPNGSGKTTLFHLIMGLLKPVSGSVEIFGRSMEAEQDFAGIRHRIGLLFQDADDQLFCPTVLEDVSFGPLNMGKSKKKAIEISKRTLDFLGLSAFENRITFKLSGGEKKLVSLATVLSMEPEVLLLDEPLTGLDIKTQTTITRVLKKMNISYIIISHNIEFLEATTSITLTMHNGKIYTDDQVHVHIHDHAHVHGNVPHKH